MIKTFLKHHIYEFCINQIFSQIENNFKGPISTFPKVGEIYSRVVCTRDIFIPREIYYDCRITDIDMHYLSTRGEYHAFVEFTWRFHSYDSKILNPAKVNTNYFNFYK